MKTIEKNKILNIGVIIADDIEFIPFKEAAGKYPTNEAGSLYGNKFVSFTSSNETKTIKTTVMYCGIGKVNCSSAASFLITLGCDIVLNFGLSGGISEVKRGEIVFGTSYIEVDFDLTPLGYPLAKKPSQDYIYNADENLFSFFTNLYPEYKTGKFGCGDSFLSNNEKKILYKNEFNIISYDMECAAAASVCYKNNIPFLSVKKISDDGTENSNTDYLDMNKSSEKELAEIFFENIDKFFEISELWK